MPEVDIQLLIRASAESRHPERDRAYPAGRHVRHPHGDNVTASKLAIDRQVEEGEIARLALHLKLSPDRPNVARSQRRFCTEQLAPYSKVRTSASHLCMLVACPWAVSLFERQTSMHPLS